LFSVDAGTSRWMNSVELLPDMSTAHDELRCWGTERFEDSERRQPCNSSRRRRFDRSSRAGRCRV